jgi:hypothetical protein
MLADRKWPRAAASAICSHPCVAELELGPSHPCEVALCPLDVLVDARERHAVFRDAARRVVVCLHTEERPKGLPRGTKFVGAAMADSERVDATEMNAALEDVVRRIGAAWQPLCLQRVVFVCQAGVNRSTLALCYYLACAGTCTWQEARAKLVSAKRAAAVGWPTLANRAFEAFLDERFPEVAIDEAMQLTIG